MYGAGQVVLADEVNVSLLFNISFVKHYINVVITIIGTKEN